MHATYKSNKSLYEKLWSIASDGKNSFFNWNSRIKNYPKIK